MHVPQPVTIMLTKGKPVFVHPVNAVRFQGLGLGIEALVVVTFTMYTEPKSEVMLRKALRQMSTTFENTRSDRREKGKLRSVAVGALLYVSLHCVVRHTGDECLLRSMGWGRELVHSYQSKKTEFSRLLPSCIWG